MLNMTNITIMIESQQPVTKEMWYQAQKYQADAIKEIRVDLKEQLDRIEGQTMKTNGRVRVLEKTMWMVSGAVLILGWLYTQNFLHCLGKVCNTIQEASMVGTIVP